MAQAVLEGSRLAIRGGEAFVADAGAGAPRRARHPLAKSIDRVVDEVSFGRGVR